MQTPPRGKRDCTEDRQTCLRQEADAAEAPAQRTSFAFWWICLLGVALALGRLTLMPCTVAVVMMMKITSST